MKRGKRWALNEQLKTGVGVNIEHSFQGIKRSSAL